MASQSAISVRFWGVRGSIACPGATTLRYGGNTSCVEVRCGDRLIIFDGGTGMRELGSVLLKDKGFVDADIFFSHTHLDHIDGLPFFAPFFAEDHRLRLWAGHLLPTFNIEQVIRKVMSAPLFPIEVEMFRANIEFRDFRAGDLLMPYDDVMLHTIPLDHPDGSTGYRLEFAGRSLVYLTDTELRAADYEYQLAMFARGADLVIFDCTYTDAEIAAHAGWGHSTWRQGLRVAEAAGAKSFCLFHHDPSHNDAFMDAVGAEAAAARPNTVVAREGMVIEI